MGDSNKIITIGVTSLTRLQRTFSIQNVSVISQPANPYTSNVPAGQGTDTPLYMSDLNTPVYTDLTLGDPTVESYNKYTDNNNVQHSFTPMTFATCLITVQQSKKIVVTEIQGRDGTVKEYIGMDDFQITINGIIPGVNGQYPQTTVNQLFQILKAPIPIAVVGWWINNLEIYNVVIKDFTIPQVAGGYSEQTFTITAISDTAQEIKFIPSA